MLVLGGGRSSGLGQLEEACLTACPDEWKIPKGNQANRRYVLLSPCYPTQAMQQQVQESPPGSNRYTLISRSGWIYDEHGRATDIRKPTVRMFETGSCFSVKPEGELVSVGNERYPSFRYGIPYCVEG